MSEVPLYRRVSSVGVVRNAAAIYEWHDGSSLSLTERHEVHRVSSSCLGLVDPSFRALSGRLKFRVRRHKFNTDSLS